MSRADKFDELAIGRTDTKRYQECEAVAKTILGDGYAIAPVEHQGPLGYTFVGTPTAPKYVISFRFEADRFDPETLRLAKAIHGGSKLQSLVVYKMSYLPGRDFRSLASQEAQLSKKRAITRRTTLVKSLARQVLKPYSRHYYARPHKQPRKHASASRWCGASSPFLFGPLGAKVLAHGDLSSGNVLLDDENTWDITSILGWSASSTSASVQSFAVDLWST
ncbi:hypothetical protein SLS62_011055 [Diatrype stigma]|uniref:Aminoglycoside phosphotransferase domain-containing protein n=1 Tax=Diatrype stigma TaxID=117547 RepID=A0AAN9UD24_9PEZI